MIQIATVLPSISVGPVPPILRVAESGASSFALALSSLLVPGTETAAKPGEAVVPETAAPTLQMPAEPGKELPEIGLELPQDDTEARPDGEAEEETPVEQDPAFAWFALPAPPVTEQPPVAIAVAVARTVRTERPEIPVPTPEGVKSAAPEVLPASKLAPDPAVSTEAKPAPALVAQPAPPPATRLDPLGSTIPSAAPAALAEASAAPAPVQPALAPTPQPSPVATSAPAPAPARASAPAPAPAPTSAPAVPVDARATAEPVSEPRAAPRADMAVQAASAASRPAVATMPEIAGAPVLTAMAPTTAAPIVFTPLRRAIPRDPDQPSVTGVVALSAAALQRVAAAPDVQQGALDLRRQEWMGQMVERIETLRDAAPIRETRIALIPDALGKVDISVRQDGDRVHVHFAAETQAARQILTDAQPRLAELAESRGVRLGHTSVDSGQAGANAQSGQRHDGQRPQTPSAPPRARAEAEFTATEERVA